MTNSSDGSVTTTIEADPVMEFVMEQLEHLRPEEVAVRTGELIELCTRTLATKLAQQRALAILAMHDDGLTDAEVAEKIPGMSSQRVTKLLSYGRQSLKAGVVPLDYHG